MSKEGAVKSSDLFPRKDMYNLEPKKEEKKLPLETIAGYFGMKDGDIGIIVMEKRETGGYIVSTALLTQQIIKSQPTNLGNLLETACRKLIGMFLEKKK